MKQSEIDEIRDRILNPINNILNNSEDPKVKSQANRVVIYLNSIKSVDKK